MKSLIISALIITIILAPVNAWAQSKDPAGVLPGDFFYFADRLGEWIEINLLTLPTREKQKKLLEAAEERVQELAGLSGKADGNIAHYQTAVSRYRGELERGEDMMEKLLFLDGAEINLAVEFEQGSRMQEQELYPLLLAAPEQVRAQILEAINAVRFSNQKMFEYMVINYQFTQEDIEQYSAIVGEHIDFVSGRLREQNLSAAGELSQARELLQAGLNIDAYVHSNRAKNVLYSAVLEN